MMDHLNAKENLLILWSRLVGTGFSMAWTLRGVARILQRGFPPILDPTRGSGGAQPPDANEQLILIRSLLPLFSTLHSLVT